MMFTSQLKGTYEDFSGAAHFLGKDEHFGEGRVDGQLNHLAAQRRQGARIVQRTQHLTWAIKKNWMMRFFKKMLYRKIMCIHPTNRNIQQPINVNQTEAVSAPVLSSAHNT